MVDMVDMVDIWRVVASEESRCPVLYCPSNGWISERSKGRQSIPFVVYNAGTDQHETGNIMVGPAPRVSTIRLPDVTARDQISLASPCRISYRKRSTTGGGNGLGTMLKMSPALLEEGNILGPF